MVILARICECFYINLIYRTLRGIFYSMGYTDNDDNITDTRLKLEGSTYFLDQARINQNRWKFFNFYINAFFSSAYSVPEVMQMAFQKRLKDPENFYKWAEEARHRLNSQFPSEFREISEIKETP